MERPTAAKVIEDLGPLFIAIRETLRHGIKKAHQYFDDEREEPDPWLGPDLVRWNAKRMLDGRGHAVENLADYERTPASNNGLRINCKNYLILIRKSDDGLLPVPTSDIQRGMYNANLELFESNEPRQALDVTTTLAVLWDCDREYTDLTSLVLALPKAGGDTREKTEAYWYEPILNLGDAQQDLDIQRRDDEQQGTGETG